MRKKGFVLSGIGFLSGMIIGSLIAALSAGTLINAKIAARTGSEAGSVIIQTLLSGLLGAIAMGSMVIYEMERWSILRCTAVHYLLTEFSYVLIAALLGWFGSVTELLISLGVQLAIYLVIWTVMYRRYRAKVRELNQLLARSRSDGES